MNNILIKNGMVVSPDGVKKQDVLLPGRQVAALEMPRPLRAATVRRW